MLLVACGKRVSALPGGVPIAGVAWAPAALPARPAGEMRAGSLDDGFDVLPAQVMTPAAAQALCEATPACTAVAYAGPAAPTPPSPAPPAGTLA